MSGSTGFIRMSSRISRMSMSWKVPSVPASETRRGLSY